MLLASRRPRADFIAAKSAVSHAIAARNEGACQLLGRMDKKPDFSPQRLTRGPTVSPHRQSGGCKNGGETNFGSV
jgi:hypothetical protein